VLAREERDELFFFYCFGGKSLELVKGTGMGEKELSWVVLLLPVDAVSSSICCSSNTSANAAALVGPFSSR
jgi:hypothetical protein